MRSRALWLSLCLVAACSGDDGGGSPGDGGDGPTGDAAPGDGDAAAADAGFATPCEEYCAVIAGACTDTLEQYADRATCLATCALFPAGEPGDEIGDSFDCRLHHAELAASEPGPHCYHAGPSGGRGDGVCGAPCDGYCDIMLAACDEYAGEADCMTACADFPDPRPFTIHETSGDSVACRILQATRATLDDAWCAAAGAASETCVD